MRGRTPDCDNDQGWAERRSLESGQAGFGYAISRRRIVPVRYLYADEYADDDEARRDGGPILGFHMVYDAAQRHVSPLVFPIHSISGECPLMAIFRWKGV